MKTFLALLLPIGFALIFTGCERSAPAGSKVAIQLPTSGGVGAMSNCSVTKCLKGVVVNVSGEGFDKVVARRDTSFDDNSEIAKELELEVPSGKKRHFKLVAIFIKADKHYIQYGEADADLFGETTPPLTISLGNESEFKGGQVAGRFLTGPDSGPTGPVFLSFSPPNSDFQIEQGSRYIINGWFNFDASENFKLTAKMLDGTVLFENKTLNDIAPIAGGSQQVARIHNKQSPYFRMIEGGPQAEGDQRDYVYGYFSATPSLVAAKTVCTEYVGGDSNYNNMWREAAMVNYLTYNYYDSGTADIFAAGGTTSNSSASCTGSTFENRFKKDRISVNMRQLYQNGRDETVAMEGAFSYTTNGSGDVTRFKQFGDATLAVVPLEGIYPTLFDGGRLFKKDNFRHGHFQNMQCNGAWMSANGFSEIPVGGFALSPVYSGDSTLYFKLDGTLNTADKAGFILCPVKAGNFHPDGAGGIFLGGLVNAQLIPSSPSIAVNFGTPVVLQIDNYGTGTTQISYDITIGGNFTYTGGSYPGTGTSPPCGTSLAGGSSCQIGLDRFSAGGSDVNFQLRYNRGDGGTTSGTVNVTLTGS